MLAGEVERESPVWEAAADAAVAACAAAGAPGASAVAVAAGAVAAKPAMAARGDTWVTGACCPMPETDRPRLPTLARWPVVTSVCWPVFSDVTCTVPRVTDTRPSVRPTATVKCVPLTTAASIGVSTEKCWTFCFSTSNETVPARSTTVVDRPSLGRSLTVTMLRGPMIMLSVPRWSSTRDRSPVVTATPDVIAMPAASSVLAASVSVQARPDTLDTCQSAAQAVAPCRLDRMVIRPVTASARERSLFMLINCAGND